jgi:hypothetical protein
LYGLATDTPTVPEALATSSGEVEREFKHKRSTTNGDARSKIIAALTNHHQYENGSCLNFEPAQVNPLAREIGVSSSVVSGFFKKKFGSHTLYKNQCGENATLVHALRILNNELTPKLLNRNLSDADQNIKARE